MPADDQDPQIETEMFQLQTGLFGLCGRIDLENDQFQLSGDGLRLDRVLVLQIQFKYGYGPIHHHRKKSSIATSQLGNHGIHLDAYLFLKGSSAFNLLITIGLTVLFVKKSQPLRIDNLNKFLHSTIWSLLAFIWLFLILFVFSPNEIVLWEAVATLLFYAVMISISNRLDNDFIDPGDRKLSSKLNEKFNVNSLRTILLVKPVRELFFRLVIWRPLNTFFL